MKTNGKELIGAVILCAVIAIVILAVAFLGRAL